MVQSGLAPEVIGKDIRPIRDSGLDDRLQLLREGLFVSSTLFGIHKNGWTKRIVVGEFGRSPA